MTLDTQLISLSCTNKPACSIDVSYMHAWLANFDDSPAHCDEFQGRPLLKTMFGVGVAVAVRGGFRGRSRREKKWASEKGGMPIDAGHSNGVPLVLLLPLDNPVLEGIFFFIETSINIHPAVGPTTGCIQRPTTVGNQQSLSQVATNLSILIPARKSQM